MSGPVLFTVENAPRNLPIWDAIISDLGNPEPARIARVLGVGRSTVYRWAQDGGGPRIACLALFWLTRWGRSEVDSRATNDAIMAVQLARSLTDERDQLARQVQALERETLELAYDLATTRRDQTGRGSAAIDGPSRKDMDPSAASEADEDLMPRQRSDLRWPALEAPLPAIAWMTQQMPQTEARGCPGSPEAPRQGAHSAICRALGHSSPPRPSERPEFLPLSPLDAVRSHSDAIMASSSPMPDGAAETCFRWDKPGEAGPGVLRTPGTSLTALGHARPPAPSDHPPGLANAAECASGRAANSQAEPAAAHASRAGSAPGIRSAGVSMAGRSRPEETAPGPSLLHGLNGPLSWGSAPYPPPRAASPPGAMVFAAIVTAATVSQEIAP